MALHNLVFVIDADGAEQESEGQLEFRRSSVRRGILHILLHFGYSHGFEKVRWGYTFFHSKTGRNNGLVSKVSDFKELHHKSVEDFEQEFESKFNVKDQVCPPRQRHQHNHSLLVQNALKETLLDFQWDRPDITSPTKLSLRPRRSGRTGNPSVSQEEDMSNCAQNIVFIVSPCPRSRTQLMDYLCLRGKDQPVDVTEFIISKTLHNLLGQRQVVLHWVDSRDPVQVSECADCLGFNQLRAVLAQQGGRVIPVRALLQLCCNDQSAPGEAFTFSSCLGYLLSSERLYGLAFPLSQGVLLWQQGDRNQSCEVTMEPVSRQQNLLCQPVEVRLKELLQAWDPSVLTQTSTESWVLQGCTRGEKKAAAFQELISTLSTRGLHMVAEVTDNGLVCSAVFSPLSPITALLTIVQPRLPQLSCTNVTADVTADVTAETSADLPDVVSSVLQVVYDIMKEDCDKDTLNEDPVPEWAQQEISRTPLTTNTLETWFPQSDQSGVSAHLMESMRLLHAVPEQSDQEGTSALQQELLSGLSELYQTHQKSSHKRSHKRGAQRTPVKQRMRSMSRALQMLNVARLNVKAQKNQADAEQLGPDEAVQEKPMKRRSSDRNKPEAALGFTTEAELISHLKSSYERFLAQRDSSLNVGVQQLLSAIKTFFTSDSDQEVKTSSLVQQQILKSSKAIRQLYGPSADADNKVRECQLQVFLRLELCRLGSPEQSSSLNAGQMAEEVAEMLRIISLTKDPVIVTQFLQDEILPVFLSHVPRVLAEVYYSLGTQLPKALVAVLPADFFSDESITQDSVSPSTSSPPLSAQSQISDDKTDLRDLRTRSVTKRRSGMLTRHRSMTESSQALRQIEIPKKSTRASKSKKSVVSEESFMEPPIQKQETKEVTKVRRNLFNQEGSSPSKKTKLPRSQSVSAVEGLRHTRSRDAEGTFKLLTKKVCDTPLHKQVSGRLLQRQKMGRTSLLSEECIVEESPVKPGEDLRRSPRLQTFKRRHSSTFYSNSQPRSRNLERVFSASQLSLSDGKLSAVNISTVRSPMRLLFGAAQSPTHLADRSRASRASRPRLSAETSVFESPNKTPIKSPNKRRRDVSSPSSPQTPRIPQTPDTSKSLSSFAGCDSTVTEPLQSGSTSAFGMTLRHHSFRSPANKRLVMETPNKGSQLKGILKTPVKALVESVSSSGAQRLTSPVSRTPKKSVTWSPSPCLQLGGDENSFGVQTLGPPGVPPNRSPTLSKRPDLGSPNKGTNAKRDLFKSPKRSCHVSLLRISANQTGVVSIPQEKPSPDKRSCAQTLDLLESCSLLETWPLESSPPPQFHFSPPNNQTPSPKHQMVTRSGRTPVKTDSDLPVFSSLQSTSDGSSGSVTQWTSTRSNETDQCSKHNLRSHFSENVSFKLDKDSPERGGPVDKGTDCKGRLDTEPSQLSEMDCSSQTEPPLDSSCGHSATTDSDSIDIVDAAIVNTQLSGGLKMNICFSRKPSVSAEDCSQNDASFKQCQSPKLTPGRSYGFRQTPDRRQREAAARLGYANESPRFSTPRGLSRLSRRKNSAPPTPLTYQVEMEIQSSGLPKLKFKRTDSMNTGEPASDGGTQWETRSPLVMVKPLVESSLALFSKPREAGCVSPSMCAHVTPAKTTPGKGGSVQTYICQSYTPTRCAPLVTADIIPMTPSPQSAGKRTPESLNSWPRRKKAQVGVCGGKDRSLKAETQPEEFTEEAELGVSLLPDTEDVDGPSRSTQESTGGRTHHSPLDELFFIEQLTQHAEGPSSHRAEGGPLVLEEGFTVSAATPPSSKRRKPVTPGGILALTQSPMLFKTRAAAPQEPSQLKDGSVSGRGTEVEDPFPFSQPNKRKTYSRKRLIP